MRNINAPKIPKKVFHAWQEAVAMENEKEYLTERLHNTPCGKRNQVQGGKCEPGNLCATCRKVNLDFLDLMAKMYPAK